MNVVSSIRSRVLSRLHRPSIKIDPVAGLRRLGSGYGGWTILDDGALTQCFAISGGLGEDASFDVEFATAFDATVLIVDPTPKAVDHFDAIAKAIGRPASSDYTAGGKQPVAAYPLDRVRADQLQLFDKALWINNDPLRFYKPTNPDHVSHSAKFATDDYITVETITINDLIKHIDRDKFALLKMDIEGAEIDVLSGLADWDVLPRQLLVEFDALRNPGSTSRGEVENIDALLRAHSYLCRHFDGDRNYLYTRG